MSDTDNMAENMAGMNTDDGTQAAAPSDQGTPTPARVDPAQAAPAAAAPAPAQGQPQAKPDAPAQANPAAQPQAQPQDNHASLFQNIFGVLNGGSRRPVLDENGKPVTDADGKIKTQQMTTKDLGKGVLAGALASMMAGFQHLPERDGNGVMRSHLNEAAQAGAAAGAENSQPARNAKVQGMADADRVRAYQTMDQNMKLHAMAISADRMDDEQRQHMVDQYAPLRQSIPAGLKMPDGTPFIVDGGEDVGEDEMQKLMKSGAGPTTHSAMPTGQRVNPTTGKNELTWTVFNNAGQIPITKENAEQYGFDDAAAGTSVPISVFMQHAQAKATGALAEGVIGSLNSQMNEFNGDKKSKLTLADVTKAMGQSFNSPKRQAVLQSIAGLPPDKAIEQLQKSGETQLAAVLAQKLGVDTDKWAKKRADELDEQKKQNALDIVKQEKKITLDNEKELARYKKSIGVADSDIVSAKPYDNNWADPKTGKNWDMTSIPVSVVDGNADPSQLSKKSKDYDQKIKEMNAYSYARYGKPFNLAKAQSDFTFSKAPATQNTMKLLRSLTGDNENTGGSLAQLDNQYKALGNSPAPDFNEIANWGSKHVGNDPVTNFQATAFGVYDEMAKLLGGGTATVEGYRQAQQILSSSFSNDQGKGAIKSVRGVMANRQNGMIGEGDAANRYMLKDYGMMKNPVTQQAPQGATSEVKVKGVLTGHIVNGAYVPLAK